MSYPMPLSPKTSHSLFTWYTSQQQPETGATTRRSRIPLKANGMVVHGLLGTILLVLLTAASTGAETFRSDSTRFKNSNMDIVVTETERHPRTSVVDIQIKAIGSSVGSSFFLLCSVRDLARQRGNYRYVAKAEEQPSPNHMVIGFLKSATEKPEQLDLRLVGQQVIDLEQFAPICDKMQ